MLRKCAGLGLAVTILSFVLVSSRLTFLKQYTPLGFILDRFGLWILLCLAVVFVNVTLVSYMIARPLSMSATGRKLEHVDRSLKHGTPVMGELAERLERE